MLAILWNLDWRSFLAELSQEIRHPEIQLMYHYIVHNAKKASGLVCEVKFDQLGFVRSKPECSLYTASIPVANVLFYGEYYTLHDEVASNSQD